MTRELMGYDDKGRVFEDGPLVRRVIEENYKAAAAALHGEYVRLDLKSKGVVETRLRENGDLEHTKLTISYPFEWPANMFKDALLFHLRLLADLERSGLTLKDAIPGNILFRATSPVFVDFLSLVPANRLREEGWLEAERYRDPRFAVVDRMLVPHFLIPFAAFVVAQGDSAREMLSQRSCNGQERAPSLRDAVKAIRKGGRSKLRRRARAMRLVASTWLSRRFSGAAKDFHDTLRQRVAATNVTPPISAYSSYYDEKREDSSYDNPASFLPKQAAVHKILSTLRPKSVLDIGANTGWYSLLAARSGASVISLEQDESCVDILYRRAKKGGLDILPLKVSFADLTRAHFGKTYAGAKDGRDFQANPLFRPAVERLQCELVLVLGLVHHLVLGEGRTVESVFETLARLAESTLVLEFVDLPDDKITGEPSFFPNLARFDQDSYSLERFLEAGRRHFASVEIVESNPDTRKILVFRK